MLDVLNELFAREEPIAFDSDCREGICGQCGIVINGIAHGGGLRPASCTCVPSTMATSSRSSRGVRRASRSSGPGGEPLRRVIIRPTATSVNTGAAPDAHATPFRSRTRIARSKLRPASAGACVAACPDASAMLFTSAKVAACSRRSRQGLQACREHAQPDGRGGLRLPAQTSVVLQQSAPSLDPRLA